MRFTTRLILTAAVLVLTAVSADAGPLRNAVANWRANRGGCGGCQPTAAPVQYQPAPVTMPQAGTVQLANYQYTTSYAPPVVTNGVVGYTPVRMGGVMLPTVPTCSNGTCR